MEPSFFDDFAGDEQKGSENGVQKKQDTPQEKPISVTSGHSAADKTNVKTTADTTKKSKSSTSSEKEGGLAVDVFSSGSFMVVRAFVAGAGIEDIDVSLNQDVINIRGSRQAPDDSLSDGFYYQELFWGSFSRKITLPVGVDIDKVEAHLKNGILTIKVLKLDRQKEEKVEITAN